MASKSTTWVLLWFSALKLVDCLMIKHTWKEKGSGINGNYELLHLLFNWIVVLNESTIIFKSSTNLNTNLILHLLIFIWVRVNKTWGKLQQSVKFTPQPCNLFCNFIVIVPHKSWNNCIFENFNWLSQLVLHSFYG